MNNARKTTGGEPDEEYVARSLERYVDEVRRRIALGDDSIVRIGVKLSDGSVESIKMHSEDDLERLG